MRLARLTLAAATLAACDGPALPDRPEPYPFRLEVGDPVFRWPEHRLPVRIFADPVGALPEHVERAARDWEAQFLWGEFRATLLADSTEADVLVRWLGDAPPAGPLTDDPPVSTCSGATTVPPREEDPSGQLRYTAPFRIRIQWFPTSSPSDIANCVARVTSHELGHALGIFAHSPNPDDLMALVPLASTPTLNDRATVRHLYHLSTDILPWAAPPGTTPPAVTVAGH